MLEAHVLLRARLRPQRLLLPSSATASAMAAEGLKSSHKSIEVGRLTSNLAIAQLAVALDCPTVSRI